MASIANVPTNVNSAISWKVPRASSVLVNPAMVNGGEERTESYADIRHWQVADF